MGGSHTATTTEEEEDEKGNDEIDPFDEEDWDEKDAQNDLSEEEQKKRDFVTNIIIKIDNIVERLIGMSISDFVKSPYLLIINNNDELEYKKKLKNGNVVNVSIGNFINVYGRSDNYAKNTYDFKIGEDTRIDDVNLSIDTIDTFNRLKNKVRILSKRIIKRNSFDDYDDIFENNEQMSVAKFKKASENKLVEGFSDWFKKKKT